MAYAVKELFYTLQGEGVNAGRAAVFCRFSGCNLWSGLERDRASAVCRFCDTDFVGTNGDGGGKFKSAVELADAIGAEWRGTTTSSNRPFVVFTGGEPFLQLDKALVEAMHERGFEVAVETNGTVENDSPVDWICVSPKAGSELRLHQGDELKLVFPQEGVTPRDFESLSFRHFFLQPMDGPNQGANTRLAIEYCMNNPTWRLSLQTHKYAGIR